MEASIFSLVYVSYGRERLLSNSIFILTKRKIFSKFLSGHLILSQCLKINLGFNKSHGEFYHIPSDILINKLTLLLNLSDRTFLRINNHP